jgi:hypothetical protein
MTTKRNRHERGLGTTSQAYNCTRYSLLCYRAPSFDPVTNLCPQEYLTDFKKRHKLTDKNIRTLLERKVLVLQKWRHRYYVAVKSCCEEYFKDYCLYKRKNHLAKKGKGRLLTGMDECDEINRTIYPNGYRS